MSTPVGRIDQIDRAKFDQDIRYGGVPVILRGIAAHWPAVRAANASPQALGAYLKRFDSGQPTEVAVCPREQAGQFFYNNDMSGVNFQTHKKTLSFVADWCLSMIDKPPAESVYVQAQPVGRLTPGMVPDLPMPLLDAQVMPRMWIGNTLRTQTHFDYFANIAVHVAGKKTFTLFAPDQTGNLYPGPLDMTPAGVPISMASLEAPDFDRFPRLKDAIENAMVAELEPGDGLFIPPLWWHHVQTTGPLNMLVNYWWNDARPDMFDPIAALRVAALAYKNMPEAQRDAWKEMLDYFVFETKGDPVAHLPPHTQGLFRRQMNAAEFARFMQRYGRSG